MSAKLDTSLLQRFALSVIATNLNLSTPITLDTDIQMNQSALAANTGGWNKGRENKRQRASPLAEKEAGLFSANHKAKQWHFLCAVSWTLVLNESDSKRLWIPTFNNQNQKPKQKYLSLTYWTRKVLVSRLIAFECLECDWCLVKCCFGKFILPW